MTASEPCLRTNYVLVDLENVQPNALDQLEHAHFKLLVFVGANQAKLPFELAAALQRLGPRAEYVKISGNGSNALDFHIAYYIGKLAATDTSAFFHIISKDTGFDPLLVHLKSKNVFAGRVTEIAEIPLVKAASCKSPTERLAVVMTRLRQMKASKPRTLATLGSTIASLFQKQLVDSDIADLIHTLRQYGHLSVAGTKISWTLPDDG